MFSRGRGASRGIRRGGSSGRGGRGGGHAGGAGGYTGPPAEVIEAGTVVHDCEEQLLVKSTLQSTVPYFNGRIFLANKQEIGKVDEILGPVNDYYFSVTLATGFKARSFEPNSTLYIDPQQTLPVARFLTKPGTAQAQAKKRVIKDQSFKKPGLSRGGRGGRGASFGAGRGSSAFRGGLSRGRGGSFRGRGG
ncbi:gar1 protein RNA binding region containing protein, putative [Babesia bigemina]|uniref:H/ACA ribonucleoprotein complex subunit n=1 Tax=Babesia bigemina TaxID=5866 RepID=A0A061DBD6_BABBI|nr:gar1 protein RNA binding region containing protein, putative [Babesia bigemina]CDR95055.1 gar1 protein RNA binding region containing protein, putative [Babesia bigemina]|eukprot:XP_012767241.1 gar1 protein RNA binding region containing protein, putative [Babesia bigemina]